MMTAAYLEYGEVSVMGILPVGMVMCTRAVEHNEVTFLDLTVAVPW